MPWGIFFFILFHSFFLKYFLSYNEKDIAVLGNAFSFIISSIKVVDNVHNAIHRFDLFWGVLFQTIGNIGNGVWIFAK